MLENQKKGSSIWKWLHVFRTGIKRCDVSTYKYIRDSFNSFISRPDGNEDLLKSFWDRFHKPSQDARDLGFRVSPGIWQETFTVAVTGISCTHRLRLSDILERRGKEQPVWSWLNKIKIYELSNLGRSHFVYILWLAMLNSYPRASECVWLCSCYVPCCSILIDEDVESEQFDMSKATRQVCSKTLENIWQCFLLNRNYKLDTGVCTPSLYVLLTRYLWYM